MQTEDLLTIRAATPADAASLATIGTHGFAAAHQAAAPHRDVQQVLTTAWSEKRMTEVIANPEIQTLVAETIQGIGGLICLTPSDLPSYRRDVTSIELGRFYLHPDWMGRGVGSKLISHALHQACQANYDICWLRVWQGNKTAIRFYQRWGFTTISVEHYAIGKTPVPVWVMIHPFQQ